MTMHFEFMGSFFVRLQEKKIGTAWHEFGRKLQKKLNSNEKDDSSGVDETTLK